MSLVRNGNIEWDAITSVKIEAKKKDESLKFTNEELVKACVEEAPSYSTVN